MESMLGRPHMPASDSSAKYAHKRPHELALTKKKSDTHKRRETKTHSLSHRHYVKWLPYLEKHLTGV